MPNAPHYHIWIRAGAEHYHREKRAHRTRNAAFAALRRRGLTGQGQARVLACDWKDCDGNAVCEACGQHLPQSVS